MCIYAYMYICVGLQRLPAPRLLGWDSGVDVSTQVCLKLMKGQQSPVSMCDSSEGFLITSGSVLLELEPGDTVSLVPVVHNTIVTSQSSASNIFTGFLVFPTA